MDENTVVPVKLLKPKDVAAILNVSSTQVYRLLQNELPCVRFGSNTVRVRQDDLDRYITGHLDSHVSYSHIIEK